MSVTIHKPPEREVLRVQAHREELVERIGRAMREDGTVQLLQGLHLSRCSFPLKPVHSVVEPSVCVIAQGSKEVLLGESRYRYDPSQYLLTTVELPRVSQVLEASKELISQMESGFPGNVVLMFMIRGKCACFRAKTVKISGYLPASKRNAFVCW